MTQFYSDAKQDQFAANILKFKRDGYCVDIGSCHSVISNNSYYFQGLNWTSISIEIERGYNESYSTRTNGVHLNKNALEVNYKETFEEYEFPKSIDYLSLDIDTLSLDVLKILPLDEYRFKVITIEHDRYRLGDSDCDEQREILSKHNYRLLCKDVLVDIWIGWTKAPYEDWWVNAEMFDAKLLDNLQSEFISGAEVLKKFGLSSLDISNL